MEENALSYFRIKTEYLAETQNGALEKNKTEELVLASCYTEAETLVHELVASLSRNQFGSVSFEIIKTKINDVLYNEILHQDDPIKGFCCNYFAEDETSSVGLYAVKVIFSYIDEKTAKEKHNTEVFYVPASSNADATARINQHLQDSIAEYIIRDTKFDKAAAIYLPLDVQKNKLHDFDSK